MEKKSLKEKRISPPNRLIESGLLSYEASLAGFNERYQRGITPHTIHVWWARRPHSAMRALIFSSLVKSRNRATQNLLCRLGAFPIATAQDLNLAGKILHQQYQRPPRVLDMFGGGGTIPFEASLLHCESHAVDINPLSVFIQRSLLEWPSDYHSHSTTDKLYNSGKRVLHKLALLTAPLFPEREKTNIFGYFWSYSKECPRCKYQFSLSKRPWLSKKHPPALALHMSQGKKMDLFSIKKVDKKYNFPTNWSAPNHKAQCPACKCIFDKISIQDCIDSPIAVVTPKLPHGKEYLLSSPDSFPTFKKISAFERSICQKYSLPVPDLPLPKWSGIVNPALYGLDKHGQIFNPRQRALTFCLISILLEEFEQLQRSSSREEARFIVAMLSAFIDQLVDWNSRLTMWISQNEQSGRAFSGPGIPMLWDYYEMDPLQKGPGNLWAKLDRIIAGAKNLAQLRGKVKVTQGIAQDLPFSENLFDAIITDPPYYDNIFYGVLADFFYSWKRLLFQKIAPELFLTVSTNNTQELVASKKRSGSPEKAHNIYIAELSLALKEAARVLRPSGIFTFIYSHSSLKGWDAIVKSFRKSHFRIVNAEPLSIERKARPRALYSNAVNICIAFIARKSSRRKPILSHAAIKNKFMALSRKDFLHKLEAAGWCEADLGLALFAQGIALMVNSCASETDTDMDEILLKDLADIVKKIYPDFYLQNRLSI